jgi:cytochrome b561
MELYGWTVPLPGGKSTATRELWPTLHDQVLPVLFSLVIAMHLGAVLKHHFNARRTDEVRRMLR